MRTETVLLEEAVLRMGTDQTREIRQLLEENGRLEWSGAELTFERAMRRDMLSKNYEALAGWPGRACTPNTRAQLGVTMRPPEI